MTNLHHAESGRKRWIRLHRESINNPKIGRLSDHQHRAWHNCLLVANDDGLLPSIADIAFHLRMTNAAAEQVVCELIDAGLIDVDATSGPRTLRMHDWSAHQFISDSSTDRVRKHREKSTLKRNKTAMKRFGNDEATPPESEPESDTDLVLPPSEQVAPRERDERRIDFGFVKGMDRRSEAIDKLKLRAEGLGLPVDEMLETINRNKARNRPAYFTTLCVNQLSELVPGVSEADLRNAMWGYGDAYAKLCQAMLEGG